jgi:hypothetical protein
VDSLFLAKNVTRRWFCCRVVGKSRLDRGSFMIHVSTKPPTCLKQLDCMSVCGGKDKYDVCGTCKGKILDKLKCPRN